MRAPRNAGDKRVKRKRGNRSVAAIAARIERGYLKRTAGSTACVNNHGGSRGTRSDGSGPFWLKPFWLKAISCSRRPLLPRGPSVQVLERFVMERNRKWVLQDDLQEAVWKTILRRASSTLGSLGTEAHSISRYQAHAAGFQGEDKAATSKLHSQAGVSATRCGRWLQRARGWRSSKACSSRWERTTRRSPSSKMRCGKHVSRLKSGLSQNVSSPRSCFWRGRSNVSRWHAKPQ